MIVVPPKYTTTVGLKQQVWALKLTAALVCVRTRGSPERIFPA